MRKIFGPLSQANGLLNTANFQSPIAIPCDLTQPDTPSGSVSQNLFGQIQSGNARFSRNNNEAIILYNRNTIVDTMSRSNIPSDKFTKRWQRALGNDVKHTHGKDNHDEDRNDPDDVMDNDNDEDEELLSLDIRFDEFERDRENLCENILPNKYVTQGSDPKFCL